MNKITIGQYVPGNSPLHKADARMKLILTFTFAVLLFVISTIPAYGAVTVFLALVICICGVPLRFILRGLRPMMFIIIFTAILNIFMTPGTALFSLNMHFFTLTVTSEGLIRAALMAIRLIYLLAGTSLLTLTTTPLQLTYSIESVMKPLRILKVPTHEIAMMMSIALRFIPTLADETDKIMKAQTARGADFKSGSIIKRAKALVPILIPLFVSAFRRADELATAMEARCYHGGSGRTKMKQLHYTKKDLAYTVIFTIFAIITIFLNYIF